MELMINSVKEVYTVLLIPVNVDSTSMTWELETPHDRDSQK